ncbi:hypothetical protein CYMTET_2972 [Cymbomonas tetramitiformis]|uniref:Uncharacterized protein n=1 Tax=Cymbomonas tetramitiformis TaxID=36881 RepID=A0AAE0H4M3_9CHLO|nr:hypothetical protein CYMTET_2972 [Cymbomonas tetramitiformis]
MSSESMEFAGEGRCGADTTGSGMSLRAVNVLSVQSDGVGVLNHLGVLVNGGHQALVVDFTERAGGDASHDVGLSARQNAERVELIDVVVVMLSIAAWNFAVYVSLSKSS